MNNALGAPGNGPPLFVYLRPGGLGDLLPRVLSAIVLIAMALVSLWLGGIVFDLFWLCAALAIAYEWQNLIAAPRLGLRVLSAALALILWLLLSAAGYF